MPARLSLLRIPSATALAALLALALAPASGAVVVDLVEVGAPGNAPDPDGLMAGSVAEVYAIAAHEITNDQYVEFLNAVAASDPNGLFDEAMTTLPSGGIVRSGTDGSFVYSVKPGFGDRPVHVLSWLSAARFVNWLENGQPTGAQGPGTTETGSYDLTGPDPGAAVREPGATWALPTLDEWYKAAFHARDEGADVYSSYAIAFLDAPPTTAICDADGEVVNPGVAVANYDQSCNFGGSINGNVTRVGATGSQSFWGTVDQSGNVAEWTEAFGDGGTRVAMGGDYERAATFVSSSSLGTEAQPEFPQIAIGVRPVRVPEPAAGAAGALALLALAALHRTRPPRP